MSIGYNEGMKKLLALIILLVLTGSVIFLVAKEKVKQDIERPIPYPTITVAPSITVQPKLVGPEKQSIFVPYWSLKEKTNDQTVYDKYIYFGIAPNSFGIDETDSGTVSLKKFLTFVPNNKKKLLAVRMIDSDQNFAILKDAKKQAAVIAQTMSIAKENHFDGIVLDLEVSAIPFESLVKQINEYTALFYQEARKNNLSFSLTVYGDVFYRVRPFDMKELAKNADMIMVMAYDFSKAKGDPGPNFPLRGNDNYGYDYDKMTQDFLRVVPASKLTVVFGLFGYDWIVDAKGRALQTGKAITAQEIQSKFIENCKYKVCSVSRDSDSSEGEIYYTDGGGAKHIVWFEDMDSVVAKKAYLKTRGINSFSYWAYSYF